MREINGARDVRSLDHPWIECRISQPFCLTDKEAKITYVSKSCRDLLEGLDRELAKLGVDAEADHDFSTVRAQFRRALAHRTALIFEDYVAPLSKWIEFNITPSSEGLCVILSDVTERQHRREYLEGELERERLMFAGSGTAMMRIGLDGRVLAANARCADLCGFSRVEFEDMYFAQLFEDDVSPTDYEIFASLISARRRTWQGDRRIHCRDGSSTWVDLSVSLISGATGSPRFFIAVLNDIERRKDSEESLQFALDAAGMAEWDYDSDLNETRRSARFDQLFGYETPRPTWGFEDFVSHVHPEDRDEFGRGMAEALAGHAQLALEIRVTWPDGAIHWIFLRARVYSNRLGRAARMAGVVMDITKSKEIELDLQTAKLAAEDANREKSYFLANMSHEIRTPLGAIIGFSDLGVDPQSTAEDRARYFSTIQRNGRALRTLVDGILDLSKVEAGFLDIEKLPTNVRDIIDDLVNLLRVTCEAKRIALTVDVAPETPVLVQTDPVRLRQILVNVVGNAIKFTSRGKIELRILPEASDLAIYVADSGPGIPLASRHRLFSPFCQADATTTRRFGGTGLGLALSRRLARALGGELELIDTGDKPGATFRLRTPMTPVAPLAIDVTPTSERFEASEDARTYGLKNLRVLVAEDSEDNQDLIGILLSQRGVLSKFAMNGRAAVDDALAAEYDVLLMDMQMPIMDGYDAVRELRRLGYAKPILALTANAMRHDREKCLAAGCTGFLSKPIDPNQLYSALATYAQ